MKKRLHVQRAMQLLNQSFGAPSDLIANENDMLKQLSFNVVLHEYDFTVPGVPNLAPMKFRLKCHRSGSGPYIQDLQLPNEDSGASGTSGETIAQRNANLALYCSVRQAWEYCEMQTHELQFPTHFWFAPAWKDSRETITLIRCKLDTTGQLAYTLLANHGNSQCQVEALDIQDESKDMYCKLNACIWEGEKYNKYRSLTAKNIRGHKHIRSFKANGCSQESISQFGSSCWFVAVVMLLSKIEPIYNLISHPLQFSLSVVKCNEIKNWVDHDRSNLQSSQTSCQSPYFPAGLRDEYKRQVEATIQPQRGLFDFSSEKGGYYTSLLFAVLKYSQILPNHCIWNDLQWNDINPEKLFATLAPLIQSDPLNAPNGPNSKLRIMWSSAPPDSTSTVWKLSMLKDIIDKLKHVHASAPLLGGIISIKLPDGYRTGLLHARHSFVFTMCEGDPIICNWGKCDDNYDWNMLLDLQEVSNTHIISLLFIFGALKTDAPAFRPLPVQHLSFTHVVLRDPRNTVNVHVNIDTFKSTPAQVHGKVDDVKFEFNYPELQSHEKIPKKGTPVSLQLVTAQYYRIRDFEICFEADSNLTMKGVRGKINTYIGDISTDKLKESMQKLVQFYVLDQLKSDVLDQAVLVVEPKIKQGKVTNAIIQNSIYRHKGFEIGSKCTLEPHHWTNNRMVYGISVHEENTTPSVHFLGCAKMKHYQLSQNLEMLKYIKDIGNLVSLSKWNEQDISLLKSMIVICDRGLTLLHEFITDFGSFLLSEKDKSDISKFDGTRTSFRNLLSILDHGKTIPNPVLRMKTTRTLLTIVDALGLENTFRRGRSDVLDYYRNATNVLRTDEVQAFEYAVRQVIENSNKRRGESSQQGERAKREKM